MSQDKYDLSSTVDFEYSIAQYFSSDDLESTDQIQIRVDILDMDSNLIENLFEHTYPGDEIVEEYSYCRFLEDCNNNKLVVQKSFSEVDDSNGKVKFEFVRIDTELTTEGYNLYNLIEITLYYKIVDNEIHFSKIPFID